MPIFIVRVMVFDATFNNISVLSGGQFYWWRKPPDEYPGKTTDLSQACDKVCQWLVTSRWFSLGIHQVVSSTNKTDHLITLKYC
jgi:hypothetical protein